MWQIDQMSDSLILNAQSISGIGAIWGKAVLYLSAYFGPHTANL